MGLDETRKGAPPHPENEARLTELRSLGILDTPAEADFDDIARLASEICATPIGIISFVDADRQWFKSRIGVDVSETDLSRSICAHAILSDGLTEIADTRMDPRTADNPLNNEVGMRFYAGVPLQLADGLPLGTLCVVDLVPRELTDLQRSALEVLGRQAAMQIELRRALRAAQDHEAELQAALDLQDALRFEIDHRVKNSLQLVESFLRLQASGSGNPEVEDHLRVAGRRVSAIASVHDALNSTAASTHVPLVGYCRDVAENLAATAPGHVQIDVAGAGDEEIAVPVRIATSVAIVVNEFATNAFKYGFPDGRPGRVTIRIDRDGPDLAVRLADDGVGFSGDAPAQGTGLGHRIITACIEQHEGRHQLDSGTGGTRLDLWLPL
ncbi:MAG: histidine kinase dimerization/phosphoacceptor domain -containing protein [Pseudomonadota bacterium]